MATAIPEYRCILTDAGIKLDAQARATGTQVSLTHVAVGDGNGSVPQPSETATKLVHEVCRRPVERLYVDSVNPCQFWIEATIPADMGGWWIREVGIFATTSKGMVLFAVGNHAPYHKSLASSGLATEHTVRIPVLVSSDAVIEIKVDSSVYATKADLDEMRGTLTGAQSEQMKTVRCLGRHDADIVALQSGAEQTNRTLSALQRAQATDNAVQEAGLAVLERRHVEEMRDMGVSMTGVLLQQMKTLKRLSTIELNN